MRFMAPIPIAVCYSEDPLALTLSLTLLTINLLTLDLLTRLTLTPTVTLTFRRVDLRNSEP